MFYGTRVGHYFAAVSARIAANDHKIRVCRHYALPSAQSSAKALSIESAPTAALIRPRGPGVSIRALCFPGVHHCRVATTTMIAVAATLSAASTSVETAAGDLRTNVKHYRTSCLLAFGAFLPIILQSARSLVFLDTRCIQ
jgi:hypothetical protein